jgi:hypothetical protein
MTDDSSLPKASPEGHTLLAAAVIAESLSVARQAR